MSKSFKTSVANGFDTLLGDTDQAEKAKPGRKKTNIKQVTNTSQEGTKEGETRATFIVNEEALEKIKSIGYWDRLSIKEVINAAINDYIGKYEKKNGPVKPQK